MSNARARRRPAWGRLGDELRDLRKRAGLGQDKLAEALKVSESTIERIEGGGSYGGSPPSLLRVEKWADACRLATPDRAVLRALANAALDERRSYKDWGTPAEIQEGVRADEGTAMTLRNFDPWGIPGLLQTTDYARAILRLAFPGRSDSEIAEAVAVRDRRKEALYRPGRRFDFILTTEGLRRHPASIQVQRAQLDQLTGAITQEAVTFRILPSGSPMLSALATGFVLYEDRTDGAEPFVGIERESERAEKNSAADVVAYRALYEAMSGGAITGDDAVAFVHEVARSLG